MLQETKKVFLPNTGPDCSTQRSARLRGRRFNMAYEKRDIPQHYIHLQEKAKSVIYIEKAMEWQKSADIFRIVPEFPANTFRQALQSFWIIYILVTLEMGGCCPGGELGLGRLDQFLYPYHAKDIEEGIITRDEALELMELFLLCFRPKPIMGN